MRCPDCDYPLWNLQARLCPECGAAFKPSDQDFVANAVQFCCPHCDQPYHGTDERGHLVPPDFDCVSCGRAVHMDEMILRPARGLEDEQTRKDRLPWIEPWRRPWYAVWWETTWLSMTRPTSLARGLRDEGRVWSALGYCVICTLVVLVGAVVPLSLLAVLVAAGAQGGLTTGGLVRLTGLGSGAAIGATAAWTAVYIALWGPSAHLLLRLGGRPKYGLRRTMEAISYSSGTYVSTAVPIIGWNFGWIWWPIAAVLMVKEAQQVGGWRAAVSVLAFPVVSTVVVVLGYVGLMVALLAGAGAPTAAGRGPGLYQTKSVVLQVIGQADAGRPVHHAAELIARAVLSPANFLNADTETTLADVPVAGGTLADAEFADADAVRRIAEGAAAALPADAIAHRLGDYVFTHHGGVAATDDPNLWLVVMIADPVANGPAAPGDLVYIATADGLVRATAYGEMPERLEAQNGRRARHGLPALPDPATVTHDRAAPPPP